ncbi:MAG TPA: TonB family protein, partial [Longimicrobium sp.]|nr:TonB family protein [Longimicrobium sp.]
VTGISGEPAYVAEPYVEEDFGPPPTAILPARAELGRPHTDDVVDAAPRVVNVHAVETILTDRLPPALRERGGGGGLTLDVYVLTDGTVDPASIFTRSSTHPDLAPAAVDAARAMRFEPLTIAGVPTPAWVRLDVTITR